MAHEKVKAWDGNGPRPCDWCGHPLTDDLYIHHTKCKLCHRSCGNEERVFYTQLGYDGDSIIIPPRGYNIVILGGKEF